MTDGTVFNRSIIRARAEQSFKEETMDDKSKAESNFFLVSAEPISNTQPINNPRAAKPPAKVTVNALSESLNIFLSQMDAVLENIPNTTSLFQFAELEITADINARGQIVLKGATGEPAPASGIRFIFRRSRMMNVTL
jgi:hypothetical protein